MLWATFAHGPSKTENREDLLLIKRWALAMLNIPFGEQMKDMQKWVSASSVKTCLDLQLGPLLLITVCCETKLGWGFPVPSSWAKKLQALTGSGTQPLDVCNLFLLPGFYMFNLLVLLYVFPKAAFVGSQTPWIANHYSLILKREIHLKTSSYSRTLLWNRKGTEKKAVWCRVSCWYCYTPWKSPSWPWNVISYWRGRI